MHYETINTQAKIAELLHEMDCCQPSPFEECIRRQDYVVKSAFFLGKLMPTIVEEIVSQVREDEQERLGTNAALLSCSTMGEAFDRMEQTLAELATARREAEQAHAVVTAAQAWVDRIHDPVGLWGDEFDVALIDAVRALATAAAAPKADEPLYVDFSWSATGSEQIAELSSDPDRPLFRLDVERLREFVGMAADTLDFLDECRLAKAKAEEPTPNCGAEHTAVIYPWKQSTTFACTGHEGNRHVNFTGFSWTDEPLPVAAPDPADDLDAHLAEQMTDPAFADAYRARQAAAPVAPASTTACGHEYPPGKETRERNPGWHTRIVDCDLPAGHEGDHEETDTGNTWPQAAGAGDGEHPETHCHRCGGLNVPWSAPSPLWNEVMRGGDINATDTEKHHGIVCPTCFAILAQEAGIAERWRLSAERVHVPLQTVTPSGRTWNAQTWLWGGTTPRTVQRHGYTGHGHACCGRLNVSDRPRTIARCGGPALCLKCGSEAARIHTATPGDGERNATCDGWDRDDHTCDGCAGPPAAAAPDADSGETQVTVTFTKPTVCGRGCTTWCTTGDACPLDAADSGETA